MITRLSHVWSVTVWVTALFGSSGPRFCFTHTNKCLRSTVCRVAPPPTGLSNWEQNREDLHKCQVLAVAFFLWALKTIAWSFFLWRFCEICPSYAMAQHAKPTVKGESIMRLICKIVGCPNCDIHLFGRQYSCNYYGESIILYIKQLTCCIHTFCIGFTWRFFWFCM